MMRLGERDPSPRTAQFVVERVHCPHVPSSLSDEDIATIAARLPLCVWIYLFPHPKSTRNRTPCPAAHIWEVLPQDVAAAVSAMPTKRILNRDRGFVCEHMGHLIE